MYIITKLASVAHPAINRLTKKTMALDETIVSKFPTRAVMLAITSTCKRPILSARKPKPRLPTTEPVKKID